MKKSSLFINTAAACLLAFSLSATALASLALAKGEAKSNQFWWPEQLNLSPLRAHNIESNPFGEEHACPVKVFGVRK
jgi:catalase-peroxidase